MSRHICISVFFFFFRSLVLRRPRSALFGHGKRWENFTVLISHGWDIQLVRTPLGEVLGIFPFELVEIPAFGERPNPSTVTVTKKDCSGCPY